MTVQNVNDCTLVFPFLLSRKHVKMGENGRNITRIVLILVILLKRCHSQVTCSVPCALGYTCYNTRTRHGTTEPGCIPMLEYLRRIQGTTHVHTRQGNAISIGDLRVRQELNRNQFSSFRQNDPFGQDRPFMDRRLRPSGTSTFSNFQDERQVNSDAARQFRQGNQGERQFNIDAPQSSRRDGNTFSQRDGNTFSRGSTRTLGLPNRIENMRNRHMQDQSQSRIIMDPTTGQRFALVPLENSNWPSSGLQGQQRGSSSTGLNSQDSGNTIANSQNSLPIEQTPVVNKFSGQSTRSIIPNRRSLGIAKQHLDTSSPKQEPSSGPPTIIPSQVGPLTIDRDNNIADMIEQLVMQVNSGHSGHETRSPVTADSSVTVPLLVNSDVQSKGEVNQGINILLRTTTSFPVTNSWVGEVTEHSFQHENITLPESSVESVGRVSSFLKDDTGYYFLFYPQIGDLEGLRVNVTKIGFCPSIPPSLQSRQCSTWCTSDIECPDDLKCCPNGCSLLCTPPGGRGQ